MTHIVGQSITRVDARAKVTGEAKYPADFTMPGMLHAKILFAGRPHARILGIDTAEAEAVPGVVIILTAADVPVNEYGLQTPDQPGISKLQQLLHFANENCAVNDIDDVAIKIMEGNRQFIGCLIDLVRGKPPWYPVLSFR